MDDVQERDVYQGECGKLLDPERDALSPAMSGLHVYPGWECGACGALYADWEHDEAEACCQPEDDED